MTSTKPPNTSRAIVVIKPNGSDDGRERMLADLWRKAGLVIIAEDRRPFQDMHIGAFWPEYDDQRHPISLRFHRRNLLGRPMWAVLLEGPDAIERSMRIKQEFRREHAKGIFGNLIHSTAGPWEYWRHLRVCFPHYWSEGHPEIGQVLTQGVRQLRGVDRDGLPVTTEELSTIVAELTAPLNGPSLEALPRTLNRNATHSVFFRPHKNITLDAIAVGICKTMPVPLRDAIIFALQALGRGGTVLAYGPEPETSRLAESLAELGLGDVTIRGDGDE